MRFAVFELLLPLYCGGRVVILPWPTGADGESLAAAIDTYDASVVLATPTTWQLLLDAGWRGTADGCARFVAVRSCIPRSQDGWRR